MKYLLFVSLFLSQFICNSQNKSANIIKLNSIDSSNLDFKDLNEFKNLIGNVQIVLLGEPTHGEASVLKAKTRIVKFLHQELGFETLAFESPFYDFNKIDSEIKNGSSRVDCLNECIFPIWTRTEEFQDAYKYIITQNKTLNTIGFDSQFGGGFSEDLLLGDLFHLAKELELKLSETDLELLNNTINSISQEFDVEDDFPIKLFRKLLKQYNSKLDKKTKEENICNHPIHFWQQILYNLKLVVLDYYQNHPSRKSKEEFKAYHSNTRDRLMAENLLYYLEHHPNKKVICWGANAHFANNPQFLLNDELNKFKPMGGHLKEKLGNEKVFILAATCASGNYGAVFEKAKRIPIDTCNSIENQLTQDSVNLAIFPLNQSDTIITHSLDYTPIKGIWGQVYDAILFLEKTQAPKRYNGSFDNYSDVQDKAIPSEEITSKKSTYVKLSQQESNLHISGNIIDSNKNQGIPYVNIGLKGTTIGTISNLEGEFKLSLKKSHINDSICISCVGYDEQNYLVKDLLKIENSKLTMEPKNYSLNEIVVNVERLTSKKILKKAIKSLNNNYSREEFIQDVLIRKSLMIKGELHWFESFNKYSDSNGYQKQPLFMSGSTEEFHLIDQRIAKMNKQERGKFRSSNYHLHNNGLLDIVNYRKNSFLNSSKWFRYDFQLSDTLKFEGKNAYKIEFKCKYPNMRSTLQVAAEKYFGYILINMEDFAILKIESNTITNKDKIWKGKSYPAYKTEDVWFDKDVAIYKKHQDHYYLEYTCHYNNYEVNQRYSEQLRFVPDYQKLDSLTLDELKTKQKVNWGKYTKHSRYKERYQYTNLLESE